jgi:peptidoglycan/LPS O-acetylase OafA/YrhL
MALQNTAHFGAAPCRAFESPVNIKSLTHYLTFIGIHAIGISASLRARDPLTLHRDWIYLQKLKYNCKTVISPGEARGRGSRSTCVVGTATCLSSSSAWEPDDDRQSSPVPIGPITIGIVDMKNNSERIAYLDGHRGVAILLVALYHAYARWPTYVPYGTRFSDFPIFKYGNLGVELFFLLSGFVILMTLEKCATPLAFMVRRWLRLFPAMLICSFFVFFTASFFPERPGGAPTWESLLPGLTFVDHSWWRVMLGRPIGSIEGAFWSLYVEFKFYVFAAVVYYWRGRNVLIGALLLLFLVASAIRAAHDVLGVSNLPLLYAVSDVMSIRYFGWFASGAAFYVYWQTSSKPWFAIAMITVLLCAVSESALELPRFIAALAVSCLFAASLTAELIQRILRNRFFQFFGAISYPFYLMHEGMMISMIIKLGRALDGIPMLLLPLPAIALIAFFAFVIARYCEPVVRAALSKSALRNAVPIDLRYEVAQDEPLVGRD